MTISSRLIYRPLLFLAAAALCGTTATLEDLRRKRFTGSTAALSCYFKDPWLRVFEHTQRP